MLEVDSSTFASDVLQAKGRVLVQFSAAWCNPCKAMIPFLDEIEAELSGQIKFVKVDIDHSGDLRADYNIRTVPCFIAFQDGKMIGIFPRAAQKREISTWIKATFGL